MFDYLLYEFLNINFNKFNDIEIIFDYLDKSKANLSSKYIDVEK